MSGISLKIKRIARVLVLFFLIKYSASFKVAVAGASGYIGRCVVRELVNRGIPTVSIVRSLDLPTITQNYLIGSNIVETDILNIDSSNALFESHRPNVAINCLASRVGVARDAWAVDYNGGLNLLNSLEKYNDNGKNHYVMLSAFW